MMDGMKSELVEYCKTMYATGLVSSSGGNVSVRCEGTALITPTGRSLRNLRPEEIVEIDIASGRVIGEGKPSKEAPMHLAAYRSRDDVRAVVHVHSPYAVSLSCLKGLVDGEDAMPAYTPGYAARIGRLPVVPYLRPGSSELAKEVAGLLRSHDAAILRNHGTLGVGRDLDSALNIVEDIEANARIHVILGGTGRALCEDERRSLFRREGGA